MVSIKRINESHKESLANFLNSLDSESLSTYTRWRPKLEPNIVADKIIHDNISGKEIGWVSIIDKKIIAYEHLNLNHPYRKDVVREGFIVNKSYSGRGIGSILKNKCIKESYERKFFKIIALVYENNWSSLHIDLKFGFLITGIFFNEEKVNGISKYVVCLERPITLQANQIDYLKSLKKYFSSYASTSNREKSSYESHAFEMTRISKLDFITKMKNYDFSSIFFSDERKFLSIKNIENEIPNNISDIFYVFTKNKQIVCFGFLEYFELVEKQHVARIHIKSLTKNESQNAFNLLISGLLSILEKNKIEKIWLNIPETYSELAKSLVSHGFIIEAMSFGDILIGSRLINLISFAYHAKLKLNPADQLSLLKELIRKYL